MESDLLRHGRSARANRPARDRGATPGRGSASGEHPWLRRTVLIAGPAALALELGAGREEALWAGLLWATIPSVWLHSVRPLSDSSGAAAFFLAVLLLARAEREPEGRGLVWAALAAGALAGVRPQVAIALLPLTAVVAFRAMRTPRGRRQVAWAVPAGLATGLLPSTLVGK